MSEITPEERAELRRILNEGTSSVDGCGLFYRITPRLLNALESAEARVKAKDKHITTLMSEALENERNFDGMKSQWQTSEAEVARLTKERDWLAERCSELCEDDEMYSDPHKTRIVFWKEAAHKEGK